MTETILYGIPNCDTVKKARTWLDAQGVDYAFHDYKKQGTDPARLAAWIETAGVDTVLNRRGTTWRKLPEADKADVDAAKAVKLLQDNPSMIKRPIVEDGGALLVGFKEDEWSAHFS
ncbi:MAG: ArsC family reductase [Erythrobacter sp.]|nr:MAG: ArsC family reductase [Erythrobacter sp.]